MRSDKELGQILLNNKHLFNLCLCGWVNVLFAHNLIKKSEHAYLHEKIRNNRPKYKFIKHALFNPDKVLEPYHSFYWEIGRIEPRIKWIKKYLIKE